MLDEEEFLGPHGIRSISRRHLAAPCVLDWHGQQYSVGYLPAESDSFMFGGNSNWRGPVWFPINLVILGALAQLDRYYGDRLTVECPTGSGREMTLLEVATEIARRLASTFTNDDNGRRPVFGAARSSRTTRTGMTCCCSTNTSTAIRAAGSAQATRPVGPGSWRCCSHFAMPRIDPHGTTPAVQ